MLPWAIALDVVAVAVPAREWHAARSADRVDVVVGASCPTAAAMTGTRWGGRAVSVVLAVVAVAVAVGSVIKV
jgi:hypothetical protein